MPSLGTSNSGMERYITAWWEGTSLPDGKVHHCLMGRYITPWWEGTSLPDGPWEGTSLPDGPWEGTSLPDGPWEQMKAIPMESTFHRTVGCRETPVQTTNFVWRSFTKHYPPAPKSHFTTCRVERGVDYYPYPPRVPFYYISVQKQGIVNICV